jgi:hypothetical protein
MFVTRENIHGTNPWFGDRPMMRAETLWASDLKKRPSQSAPWP